MTEEMRAAIKTLIREEMLGVLKENLTVDIDRKESYNGGIDGSGNMYTEYFEITVKFDGEVIAQASS
ncbi:hypothetical protein ACYPKM_00860 [Pseudomonas aeruginosa]